MSFLRLSGSTRREGALVLTCTLACAVMSCAAARAEAIDAHYAVSLMGLRIGDLHASGSVQPQAYRMDVNARLTGLAAMVSSMELALASTGGISKKGTLLPATYATSAVSASDTRTLRMALHGGNVRAVEISPPPEYRGDRVPVTDANKHNVLDPTSALIMPVPAKASLVGPAACARTLPVYDGYARFDIALNYVGERDISIPGYSGPVTVCSARYRPVSGHLINSRSIAFMAQNHGIEVWLAPLAQSHVVVPLRVSMPTMTGQLDIEATDFQTSQAADATH